MSSEWPLLYIYLHSLPLIIFGIAGFLQKAKISPGSGGFEKEAIPFLKLHFL